MNYLTIDKLMLGDTVSYTRNVTESDVIKYAEITGDFNPAHFDSEYCKHTNFKERIVHGTLCLGYISTALGMYLPGPGTIYLSQDIKFTLPVKFNDTITATVTIIEIIKEKNKVVLETICKNQNNEIIAKGKALVMPPK